jgi:hypothetical protein
MEYLHETLGLTGAFDVLRQLESSSSTAFSAGEVRRLMEQAGAEDSKGLLQDFVASNLLHRDGDRFAMTREGIRSYLLLQAVNGADLREVYRRLSQLDSSLRVYELIREGMTKAFLRNLNDRPGFIRLYVCSPWISLDKKQIGLLTHAVVAAERGRGQKPELLVITRPEDKTEDVVPRTLRPFQDLGATIFLTKRLHTKLYIREPGRSGGYSMAIVGSQNLTRSSYLKLGIRINADGQMINQLIRYFLEITNYCHEAKKEKT